VFSCKSAGFETLDTTEQPTETTSSTQPLPIKDQNHPTGDRRWLWVHPSVCVRDKASNPPVYDSSLTKET